MNYEKLYFAFIEKFKNQTIDVGVYTEIHHILPRYAGGDDSIENLVKLTYRQHKFVHKLWFKHTNHPQAKAAYLLMNGIAEDKKLTLTSMAGKIGGAKNRESGWIQSLGVKYGKENGERNVESGHLDKIRKLANTPERQRKLKELHKRMIDDGSIYNAIKAAIRAWKGSKHTDEYKQEKSRLYKERFETDPEYKERLTSLAEIGRKVKNDLCREFSESVIENAIRDEEYLHKSSSRSKNLFVSPEGLSFESPIFAAKYYGNIDYYVIENWCKRNQFGWKRVPKAA